MKQGSASVNGWRTGAVLLLLLLVHRLAFHVVATVTVPVRKANNRITSLFQRILHKQNILTTKLQQKWEKSWRKRDRNYSPLVFFTLPRGLSAECDAMEECVTNVEDELHIRVQRLDILRDPSAEAVLLTLTQRTPPFLYHRESCQVVYIPTEGQSSSAASAKGGGKTSSSKAHTGSGTSKQRELVYIDSDRVRAWAKGRLLSPVGQKQAAGDIVGVPPTVVSQKETAMEQDELLEDWGLTPLQREGKQLIQQRTKAKQEQSTTTQTSK